MFFNLIKTHNVLGVHSLTLLLGLACLSSCATHDELPKCGLSGVYKTRQSVIESPNYPNNYPTSTCWDYVIRSPYRCPTKFHIQFLDFHLESSDNCSKDYLAIGVENDGDDMDLLCGQVIGIKKYHTPGGILRLRFVSDDSPWTTARGFKLLITRLACEREDFLLETQNSIDEDTEQILAPSADFQPPKDNLTQLFRNWSQTEQHVPYPTAPLFGWNLPVPPPPAFGDLYTPNQRLNLAGGVNKPCGPEPANVIAYPPPLGGYPVVGYRSNDAQEPLSADQYVSDLQTDIKSKHLKTDSLVKSVSDPQPRQQFAGPPLPGTPLTGFQSTALPAVGAQLGGAQIVAPQYPVTQDSSLPLGNNQGVAISTTTTQQCCTSSFHQKRFYLSSPGFPRTAFTSLLPTQQRDCKFGLEKNADNICRLRIEFKFFDFGQTYVGTGAVQGNVNVAISTTRDICTEDFIEIDGERFCGCRTGHVYTSTWGLGAKQIRMRMGYSGVPSSGFLLEIYQEECQETAFVQQQRPAHDMPANVAQPGLAGVGLLNTIANPNVYNPTRQGFLNQQQLPGYQQPTYLAQPLQTNIPISQIPYRTLQAPNLNPYLVAQQQQQQQQQLQQRQQLWLPTAPPPYAGPLNGFPPPFVPALSPFYRHARTSNDITAASTHQPMTVVETNSTRKEYYYFDADDALGHLRANDEPDDLDRNGVAPTAAVRDRCSYSTMDALRLTVDTLWITKPTCYAPLRSWFSNIFG
ncbi:uncharacterized protein LOC101451619 [Ceratitis capitata]|uniref:uncharacterized protein LOC101451619 n=1 Tax=Ceratitis capitata TaxID=7213 RepID=UPI000329F18B|nr:uncharacterized protein LOC101451619 [Ceratitis capitata]